MDPLEERLAEQLTQARLHAVTLHTVAEVDLGELLDFIASVEGAFAAKYGLAPGRMPFFIKAAVGALRGVPALRSRIEGAERVDAAGFDFSVGVAAAGGHILPVVLDCEGKTLAALARELAALETRARVGELTIPELQGGVFTLAEQATDGVMFGLPALNPPQSAALVIHQACPRPLACGESVTIRPVAHLVLAYDARVVSSAAAAAFLGRFKSALETPMALLL